MTFKTLILTLFVVTLSVAVCAVTLSGCMTQEEVDARKQQRAEQAQQQEVEWVQSSVPSGATDITDMGNGWWAFSLTSEGKTRRFLWSRHGSGENRTECITELSTSNETQIKGSNQ